LKEAGKLEESKHVQLEAGAGSGQYKWKKKYIERRLTICTYVI